MIVAEIVPKDKEPGWLIMIPFDDMKAAIKEGRMLEFEKAGHPTIYVMFGPSHDALLKVVKENAIDYSGEENL